MRQRLATVVGIALVWLWAAAAAGEDAVPIEREPAHRVVLQNEHVRVFEVRLEPGEVTLWHVHRHDGASVRLSDATVEDEPAGARATTFDLRRGAVSYGATPTALTHRVRNVGRTPFHNVYVELLARERGAADRSAAHEGDRPADLENDRVRALRRKLAPGESTALHTHALRGVAVPVTAGRLEIHEPGGGVRHAVLKPGAVQWIEPGTTHLLKNVGDAPIEIVDVELK